MAGKTKPRLQESLKRIREAKAASLRRHIQQLTPDQAIARSRNRNRNRKLLISKAPTKAKSQEPAYSQALNQNKIDRQRSRSRESGRLHLADVIYSN